MELFVQVAPGLEAALEEELREFGLAGTVEPGGVVLDGSLELVARLNLHLSTASRVLVTLASFRATGLPELERKAAALPWDTFLGPGDRPDFRVTTRKSRLYHTGAIAERLHRAASGTDDTSSSESSPTPFVVRIVRDRLVIRADASGEHLHRRGYRLRSTRAPIRETLAAGALRLTGWSPDQPLVDPMCGSGTFPIEAALRAACRPPGARRAFAFESWPGVEARMVDRWRGEALERAKPLTTAILGSDRDAGAIEAARANAEGTEIEAHQLRFEHASISEARPPASATVAGALICNPPWGRRVGDPGPLRDLHARLGQVARKHFSGWTLTVLSPSAELVRQADRRAEKIETIPSGGVSVGVWRVESL